MHYLANFAMKLSEKGYEQRSERGIWPVFRGRNGPNGAPSVPSTAFFSVVDPRIMLRA
jgi:hypothetical protein